MYIISSRSEAMRRPKHFLRAITVVWNHPKIFTMAAVFTVFLIVVLSTRYTDKINYQMRFRELLEQNQKEYFFGGKQPNQQIRRLVKSNSKSGEQRMKRDINRQVLKNPGAPQRDVRVQQHGAPEPNIPVNPGGHQQDSVGSNKVDQLRKNMTLDAQPPELEKYRPDKYPMSFNMTKIVKQYEVKGYADRKPVNLFDDKYIISPDQTCDQLDIPKVLIIVKSSPENNVLRVIIRETWANKKRFPSIRTIFSFCIPDNDIKVFKKLQEESEIFNDILLVNYNDDCSKFNWKTINSLNWAVDRCSRVQYVVPIDDDVYVAPDLLLAFLDQPNVRNSTYIYNGHILLNNLPIRDVNSQWYVTKSEFPFRNFPRYILGGFVIMSMPTVRTFVIAARYTKLFKFEDVYFGILASKTGIEPTNNLFVPSKRIFTNSEAFKTLIASHHYYDRAELQRAWDCHLSILDKDEDKSIFCDYISIRLNNVKSDIDRMISLMKIRQVEQ
ncbi:beta-1,3-galactosyltransferase 1-like [Argopecten irradians]|uniref:beta-1,3-galactosyltransferase 1-like n=1 Tax=Argopecten irradians TaxID=31199 RepID=UPI00370FB97E